MARNPQLRAAFFVAPDGRCTPKDRPTSVSLREAVFARDGWKCIACGHPVQWFRPRGLLAPNRQAHADHLIPRSRGGRTTMENLRTLCSRCNLSKAAD